MHFAKFRVNRFPVFERNVLLVPVSEQFAPGFVDGGSFDDQRVVDFAADGKRRQKRGFLRFGRRNPVL